MRGTASWLEAPVRRRIDPRGGVVDLALAVLVLVALWTRTPVGGLAAWGLETARGGSADLAALSGFFVTGPPAELVAVVERLELELPERPDVQLPEGSFPEPWRSVVAAQRPGELDALDALYAGDLEASLEALAVGLEQRARAIRRAKAAGVPRADRYEQHRAYLPAASARDADHLVNGVMGAATLLDMAWPLATRFRISSPFGHRFHPTLKKEKFHNGIDVAAPVGTPVLAAQAGRVATAKHDTLNGNYLILDHGNGVKTSYCHLDALEVEQGADVVRGARMARSGNTGRSTGPHLHFVVRVGATPLDPERFLPRDPST